MEAEAKIERLLHSCPFPIPSPNSQATSSSGGMAERVLIVAALVEQSKIDHSGRTPPQAGPATVQLPGSESAVDLIQERRRDPASYQGPGIVKPSTL